MGALLLFCRCDKIKIINVSTTSFFLSPPTASTKLSGTAYIIKLCTSSFRNGKERPVKNHRSQGTACFREHMAWCSRSRKKSNNQRLKAFFEGRE